MKLEIYFDYSCPYCKIGYDILLPILKDYPELTLEWYPCEAHPRPESHGPHSDLCARGMYLAIDQGTDLASYHEQMYHIALDGEVNIESVADITQAVANLADPAAFAAGLEADAYQDQLTENNRLAWSVHGFDAVPSLHMNGQVLIAAPGIGLTKETIISFLEQHKN